MTKCQKDIIKTIDSVLPSLTRDDLFRERVIALVIDSLDDEGVGTYAGVERYYPDVFRHVECVFEAEDQAECEKKLTHEHCTSFFVVFNDEERRYHATCSQNDCQRQFYFRIDEIDARVRRLVARGNPGPYELCYKADAAKQRRRNRRY